MSDFDDWLKKQPRQTDKPATSTPKPTGGSFDSWVRGETKPKPVKPATVLPTERQEFGRRPVSLDESLRQSARVNRGRPAPPQPAVSPDTQAGPLHESRVERNRADFARKPFTERWEQRIEDAIERGGRSAGKMVLRGVGAALGAAGAFQGKPFEVVDVTPERMRRPDAEAEARLARRRELYPQSFAGDVVEGIAEAAPQAAGALILGGLTGGGLPASMAIGGGMGAAGADWGDPKRALAQTAIGAVAPVAGGVAGQRVGGAIASRLARPVAQGAARAGGEVLGGAAGNVIGSGAEQLAFEGRLDPRELAKQGIIGGALNVPGAVGAARRRLPAPVPEQVPQPAAQPVTARQPSAPPVASPWVRQTAEMPRVPAPRVDTPQARATAEIPRVPTSPTRQIQYPDAPPTQEMPTFRQWLEAENAETAEMPATPGPALSRTAPGVSPEIRPEMPVSRPALPQATDENIQALRDRQTELGREAYDRRGDFTGDLRDEYNRLNSIIREYDNARAPRELAPPPSGQPERFTPPPEERAARREALQPKTGPMPETLTEGRKVTQEAQIPPALKPTEAFSSREDARQGYFERFNDDELVSEIARLEDVRNQGLRGRSKLSRAELEANNFDLRVAVEMQKERRRLQEQIGIDPANRIAPRTPGRPARKIQHSQLGEVSEAPDQSGVPKGKLRVVSSTTGELHVIKNPRISGNREASFVKGPTTAPAASTESKPPDLVRGMKRLARSASSPVEIPKLREQFPGMNKADFDAEMARLNEEGKIALHRHDHPASLSQAQRDSMVKIGNDYFTASTIREGKGHVMGFGLGFLGNIKLPSRGEAAETAGGVQTVAQLGNPRFVVRNIVQHVAFGKQERAATRLAAVVDWAYSKATGKGRQIAAPRGSDLASYIRNWGVAIRAHKAGQPLPGGSTPIQHTANANKIDKAVQKLMTWMNEIPDAANWQTRFEDSLKSIVDASNKSKSALNMADAIDQATMEANKAALRDPNFVSSALLNIKEGLNKLSSPIFGTDKFGAGDFILKYAQTPGALLKRGLERSPLGLFQVAKEAATPGPFRRRNTLLALSRVAEGAATGAGLGAALAAAGVLVGPEEENKTGKAFEREEGKRGYSLNASALRRLLTGESTEMAEGDQLYSIDWLQPWAMNLSAGAAVYNLHKDGKMGAATGAKTTGEAIYNSLAKTLDVMGDQSVLKNLTRYMDRAVGETFADNVGGFVKAIGLDVPSSFVPSLARQARQVADPFERDTRPEDRTGFGGFAREATGRALAQIPGVSTAFPKRPSLLTGEDRKTSLGEMGVPGRVAAQFSPANVSTFTPRAVAREISRLNKSGQDVSVSFPRPTKGEATSDLRSREKRFAETFSRMSAEMIRDEFYKDADDEMKAAAFNGLKRYLANLGKPDAEEKTVEEIVEAAIEAVEQRRDNEEDQ